MILNKKGAEDSFKGLVVGFILLTLFMFLILTFVGQVASDNNREINELEEGVFALNQYETFLDDVNENAENFRERFEKGNIFSIISGIVVEGIFGIAADMFIFVITPFTILGQVLTTILGVNILFTSVILGVIIVIMIISIWRLIKIGD